MIELRGVSKRFGDGRGGEIVAVDRLDLVVPEGETHCLLGTSGCGKTTVLRLVNRLLRPNEGHVLVGGRDVSDQDVIALRRRIGWVIQSGGLFPHMTVARNVGLLCELEGWSRSTIGARVEELLRLVDLPAEQFAQRYPADLSGGQRQRVGVARALALDPPYVLMDEPFGALDPVTRAQLQHDFRRLLARVQKTVLLVTHDLHEAFLLGDRVSLLHAGGLVQSGTEADLRQRPATPFVAAFLQGQSSERVACGGGERGDDGRSDA